MWGRVGLTATGGLGFQRGTVIFYRASLRYLRNFQYFTSFRRFSIIILRCTEIKIVLCTYKFLRLVSIICIWWVTKLLLSGIA